MGFEYIKGFSSLFLKVPYHIFMQSCCCWSISSIKWNKELNQLRIETFFTILLIVIQWHILFLLIMKANEEINQDINFIFYDFKLIKLLHYILPLAWTSFSMSIQKSNSRFLLFNNLFFSSLKSSFNSLSSFVLSSELYFLWGLGRASSRSSYHRLWI